MQSLYERAKADNARILNRGFHVTATFTAPADAGGQTQAVEIFFADTNLDINPQTGLPVKARKIAAHAHVTDFTIGNPAETDGEWKVTFVNEVWTILGLVEEPLLDRTLGMLTFRVKLLTVKAA